MSPGFQGRKPVPISFARYYNDLWEFDVESLTWTAVGKPNAQTPSPRGGCQMVVHQDSIYLYGGHHTAIDPTDKSETETIFEDLWRLDAKTYQVRCQTCSFASLAILGHQSCRCP